MNIKSFALLSLIPLTLGTTTQTKFHIYFDEPFIENNWFEDLFDYHQKSLQKMANHFEEFGASKEDREALKAAREAMDKIKYEIKDTQAGITISFSGFENLEKKDVKIVKNDEGWLGTITTKQGLVEFFISRNGIRFTRKIELSKEAKDEKDNTKARTFYSSSFMTQGDYFKKIVKTESLKAEPITNNILTLALETQKEELLQIP